MSPSFSLPSSSRSSIEQQPLLQQASRAVGAPVIRPADLLRSMSAHSQTIRSFASTRESFASSSESSSRRSSDVEFGGSDWACLSAKRRKTRRSTYIFIFIILSSGLIYTFIDNFLLADWVSARSRFRPTYLGGALEDAVDIPDHPDPALAAGTWLGHGVVRIPGDETHVLVPNPPSLPSGDLLGARRRFPSSHLVPFFSTGAFPANSLSPIPNPILDIIYTFVNASSPILLEAKEIRNEREGLVEQVGGSHHWRDNGEIRGAIRSAANFLSDGLRRIHVISADFELDSLLPESEAEDDEYENAEEGRSQWRVGQVPSWLNTTAPDAGVQWHFHSEIFRLPSDEGKLDQQLEREWASEAVWREEALPSFNSFQIESKVGWVKDLEENFILSNDDMFFLRDLNPADFHHPILGAVFRIAPDNALRVNPNLNPQLISDPGEWGGLNHANYILSRRFFPKARAYLGHVPKAMTRSVAHEASIMFASGLSRSATRGFRTSQRGDGDVHFAWLVTHLQIERWREALLWSWAVARLGGSDGVWGEEAREELWNTLRLTEVLEENGELPDRVIIVQEPRSTMDDMDEVMQRNDWEFPLGSAYYFTSLDGILPSTPAANPVPETCVFSLPECLPVDFFSTTSPLSAAEMFTHFTFVQPRCGDCLIMALINASGPRGLSAILPGSDQVFEPEQRERAEWERNEPMLPLVETWQEANFTLSAVVRPGQDRWDGEDRDGPVRLLNYCVKLLTRYTYSIADSPTHFALARSPGELSRVLLDFGPEQPYAMGCINDDQPDSITGSQSAQVLGGWMEGRFGGWVADWEKSSWPWSHAPLPFFNSGTQEQEEAPPPEEILKGLLNIIADRKGEKHVVSQAPGGPEQGLSET